MNALTIGKTARRAGVGIETIRFYERRGLIEQPPKPPSGGYREYSEEAINRIRFVRQAQELGFTLKEIDGLLALKSDPDSDASEVRARALIKLEEVERKITRLERIGSALRVVIEACPATGALSCCSIMDALTPDSEADEDVEEN